MQIEERLPDLSDKELENLHANALRLSTSGSQMQREQSERLLPLLSAAMQERRAVKLEAQQAARKVNAKRKASTKVAAARE